MGEIEQKQLFQIARFSLLSRAISHAASSDIPAAYAYAWHAGIYPWLHEDVQLHRPFQEQFLVTPEMGGQLVTFLQERWYMRDPLLFAEIESHFVRSDGGPWKRSVLIHACRYIFLSELFDRHFWGSLIKASESDGSASDAASIGDEFDWLHFDL